MTPDALFSSIVMPWLRQEEGDAYVVDPVPTRCGITQRAWDAWRKPIAAPASVADLRWDQVWVAAFYRSQYWLAAECDKIANVGTPWAPAFAFVTMDTAVNSGVHVGDILCQGAIGAAADGAIGAKTLFALTKVSRPELEDLCWLRLDYDRAAVRHDPKLLPYLPTWCGRVNRMRRRAVALGVGAPMP